MATALTTPAPVLREVDEQERARTALEQKIVAWQKDDEAAQALANIADPQVRTMPSRMADEIQLYDRRELHDS